VSFCGDVWLDHADFGLRAFILISLDFERSGSMRNVILAFLVGVLLIPVGAFLYFHFGHLPVAVADEPFPFEKQIVRVPLNARIHSQMPAGVPIQVSETNLVAGAGIYREQCAFCHGLMGHPSTIAPHMYPSTPQLWASHRKGVVGVSDDPPGETYWKVSNGIRLTGMPAFSKTLSETEMWQVTLLLANADKPLPDTARNLVTQPLNLGELPPQASPSH
jgi:thiosulfate dehydrogenase